MSNTYFDRFSGGVIPEGAKAPCDAATTGPITLSGYQVVDGVNLNADYMRCLVKSQSDETKNGIYVVTSGAWYRAFDFAGPSGIACGQLIYVTGGVINAGLWKLSTPNPVQIDNSGGQTTPPSNITFDFVAAGGSAGSSGFTVVNPAGVVLDGVTDGAVTVQSALNAIAQSGGGTLKLISPHGLFLGSGAPALGSNTTLDLTECPLILGQYGGLWTDGQIADNPATNQPKLNANITAGDTVFTVIVSGANVTFGAGSEFILRGQRNANGSHLWHETGIISSAVDNGPVSGGELWTITATTAIKNNYNVSYPNDAYQQATGLTDYSTFTIAVFSLFASDVAVGAVSAAVGNGSLFSVGDYVLINDTETVGQATGITDNNTIHQEVTRIVAISGNTLTFENGLYHPYATAYKGGVTKLAAVTNARIIGAKAKFNATPDIHAYTYRVKYSANCDVLDCSAEYQTINGVNYGPNAQAFRVEASRNCTVDLPRFMGIPDASSYGSGQGYAVVPGEGCTDCKFTRITAHNARHGLLLQGGAAGNECAIMHFEGIRISAIDTHGINAKRNHIHDFVIVGGPLFSPDASNKAGIRVGNSSHIFGDYENIIEDGMIHNWALNPGGGNTGFGIDIAPQSAKNIVRNIEIFSCDYGVNATFNSTYTTAITGTNLVEDVLVHNYTQALYNLNGGSNGTIQGVQLRNVRAPFNDQGTSTENTIISYGPSNPGVSAYISGLYYPAVPIVSFASKTVTAGRLYAIGPFTAEQTIAIAKLGVNVITGSSSGTHVALGVYTDVGGFPGVLVGGVTGLTTTDSSSADAEATSLSIPLIKGARYWLAALFESTPTINAAGSTTAHRNQLQTSTGSPAFLIKKTVSYASSLPASFPSSSVSDFAAETAPHIWFRV